MHTSLPHSAAPRNLVRQSSALAMDERLEKQSIFVIMSRLLPGMAATERVERRGVTTRKLLPLTSPVKCLQKSVSGWLGPEIYSEEHTSSIFRQSSNPV